MPDNLYGIPGSLDGPPAKPRKSLTDRAGDVIGTVVAGSVAILLVTCVWWAILWLITNMPS